MFDLFRILRGLVSQREPKQRIVLTLLLHQNVFLSFGLAHITVLPEGLYIRAKLQGPRAGGYIWGALYLGRALPGRGFSEVI